MNAVQVSVLTNPMAGCGHAPEAARKAITRLREHGIVVTEIAGHTADEAAQRARRAVAAGTDALVAAGGDGLINIAWQAVAGTGIPLGIVPAGTGNDHAREFVIPIGDPLAAADIIAAMSTKTIDLGRAGRRWFGTVLASGFDSRVTDRANRMTWPKGRMRYNVALVAELAEQRPIAYRIELDYQTVEVDATLVAIGNTSSYGGGMRICPKADPTDGLLDVTVVGHGSRLRLLRLLPTVYRGTHIDLDEVQTFQSRHVTLVAQGVTAYADGEPLGSLPVEVETVAGAGQIIMGG